MASETVPSAGLKSATVIGLGRFGRALAIELARNGVEVLGIDADARTVQDLSEQLTHVVCADSTDEHALRELGVRDLDVAVVAIGSDLEASILTASTLVQMGVRDVWAKAVTQSQGRILTQIGVKHVIFPEYDMGRRTAHLLSGNVLDYVEVDPDFALVKIPAPRICDGRTLQEIGIRRRFGVTVLAARGGDGRFHPTRPEDVVTAGDVVLVAGPKDALEEFLRQR